MPPIHTPYNWPFSFIHLLPGEQSLTNSQAKAMAGGNKNTIKNIRDITRSCGDYMVVYHIRQLVSFCPMWRLQL
jgi:hypothetical protein